MKRHQTEMLIWQKEREKIRNMVVVKYCKIMKADTNKSGHKQIILKTLKLHILTHHNSNLTNT